MDGILLRGVLVEHEHVHKREGREVKGRKFLCKG